ncbi:23S rRNA (adenine(1618)-N(6))-methyltransferase [Roseivirga misakiensis]|uniref:Ribosomal RNA large subunit methyltransferase F n=1 Tax=Roseivirga misakiensis TaxID=1563681 RepID=A0A1E5T2I6_9BACT|nr:23S rRNA (adenine(1618)-N(6))-methyltransferase [Roseivirga misakiensis]
MHPRNKHIGRYDLKKLAKAVQALKSKITLNVRKEETIDFSDPEAVKLLNAALLKVYYNVDQWDIPPGYLCPPIPGRADYIHYMADILRDSNNGQIPKGESVKCLDVGIGANAVYPIIGISTYGWSFIGSDIDPVSIKSVKRLMDHNAWLKNNLTVKTQPNAKDILYGILDHEEPVDLVICNPPFHASLQAAQEGTLRKVRNLTKSEVKEAKQNFGGQGSELWCEGGERQFVGTMIRESKNFGKSCFWFSSLVSKQSNLKAILEYLAIAKAVEVKTIPMSQGNKASRVVTWTFLTPEEQKVWKESRWRS